MPTCYFVNRNCGNTNTAGGGANPTRRPSVDPHTNKHHGQTPEARNDDPTCQLHRRPADARKLTLAPQFESHDPKRTQCMGICRVHPITSRRPPLLALEPLLHAEQFRLPVLAEPLGPEGVVK